jgi:transposase
MQSNIMLTPRAREMYSLIEQYRTSDLKQRAFCEETGIAYSTFQYWLKRYRTDKGTKTAPAQSPGRQQDFEAQTGSNFIALHPRSDITAPAAYNCEIRFPNGIIIRLTSIPDVEYLSDLAVRPRSER